MLLYTSFQSMLRNSAHSVTITTASTCKHAEMAEGDIVTSFWTAEGTSMCEYEIERRNVSTHLFLGSSLDSPLEDLAIFAIGGLVDHKHSPKRARSGSPV